MVIPCPKGSSCPGSTRFKITECYLSETKSYLPQPILKELKGLSGFLIALGMSFTDVKYEIYQCPACGSEVYFMKDEKDGTFKRLLDRLKD